MIFKSLVKCERTKKIFLGGITPKTLFNNMQPKIGTFKFMVAKILKQFRDKYPTK